MKSILPALMFVAGLTPVAASAIGMIHGPISTTPLLTTWADPSNYVVSGVDEPLSGVAKLLISSPAVTGGCSGSLIGNGGFVLTAAHCVADGGPGITATAIQIQFPAAQGSPTISMSAAALAGNIFLPTGPDGWTGDFKGGADLALIKLPSKVAATSYDIVRDPGLGLGSVVTLAGYGRSGSGLQGDAPIGFGTLRTGTNAYDAVWADFKGQPFAFDFDDGTAARDAIGVTLGAWQPGTGANEVFIAPGDSGGPTFLDGKLIGVHSFGGTWGAPFDINRMLDSSFGELGGDTRVAFYAGWIDGVITPVPEAEVRALMAMGLLGVLISVRRRTGGGWGPRVGRLA